MKGRGTQMDGVGAGGIRNGADTAVLPLCLSFVLLVFLPPVLLPEEGHCEMDEQKSMVVGPLMP